MAYKAGQLTIDLQANSAQLSRALSAAEKKTSKSLNKMAKDANKANGSFKKLTSRISAIANPATIAATAITAVTAAVIAAGQHSLELSKQLERSAEAAGLSITEFQNMSLAVRSVGIDTEQLGSILGDTEEKIGDFLATGGGGFQDFVDVMGLTEGQAIATATELQKLSGKDVLVEMVRQMEEAGVSAEKMNFALEGMASDARYLIPLLTGNAEKLTTLETKYGKLASTLNTRTVVALKEASTQTELLTNNASNFVTSWATPITEAYNNIAEAVNKWLTAQVKLNQELNASIKKTQDVAAPYKEEIAEVESEIESLRSQMAKPVVSFWGATELTEAEKETNARLEEQIKLREETIKQLNKAKNLAIQTSGLTAKLVEPTQATKPDAKPKDEPKDEPEEDTADAALKAHQDFLNKKYAMDSMYVDNAILKERSRIDQLLEFEKQYVKDKEMIAILETEKEQARLDELVRNMVITREQADQAILQFTTERNAAELKLELQKQGDILNGLSNLFGENKALAIAAFAFTKGAALAEMVILQSQAIAGVWADQTLPWYTKAAQIGVAVASIAAEIGNIQSAAIGQFHDGGMIPRDGTYYMQGGEMVIPKDTVSDFVDNAGSGSGGTTISAPITINGSVTDEAWFSKQLMKQRNVIYAAQQKSERENPTKRRR
ncbi:hypothetical protein HGP28_08930 [Vibrio sp. SM6]|uniref:Phage tail tape measure protein n=1 Tax=Vibrio agarilyticus TaxID=2726741 RepID=A0A7X8TQD2_9VIBR|nr:hypothetical protein [Vibrio agarilyticus]NLS13010.1 hypothetical protein [Vibrio agarilyticus]